MRSAAGLPKDQRRRGLGEGAGRRRGGTWSRRWEKGKSQFVGPELSGKMLGVIGWGPSRAGANIATKLGMTVFGYDPFLSVDGALSLSRLVHRAMDLETIYKNCDYITLTCPRPPRPRECSTRTHSI